jgi:hypothetical protein
MTSSTADEIDVMKVIDMEWQATALTDALVAVLPA